jgi:hypothetical protein
MQINCPSGYTEKIKAGSITFDYSDVNIYGKVCDHSDLCKNESCRFYDITEEGTQRFFIEMDMAHVSIETILENKRKEKAYQRRQELGLKSIKGGRKSYKDYSLPRI